MNHDIIILYEKMLDIARREGCNPNYTWTEFGMKHNVTVNMCASGDGLVVKISSNSLEDLTKFALRYL